jgi:ligand-binding sensor domain-containing protein
MVATATKAEREEELKALSIAHLAADARAVIAASPNGLFLKPDPDSPWRTWRSEDGVLDFNVLYVLPESAGVWAVSERGLEFYSRAAKAWERHLEVPWAPPVAIYAMASDEACLWIATALGALQYEKARKHWRTYTTLDGLPDNRVQALLLDGKHIWFGTARGAARYQWP